MIVLFLMQIVHLKEDAIPPQLLNQLERFLLAVNTSVISDHLLPAPGSRFRAKPVLLHGDLTDENVLGTETDSSAMEITSSETMTQPQFAAWLRDNGCAKYVDVLIDQEELTFASLALLTESHLKDLGIPLGPRLALLQAIQQRSGGAGTAAKAGAGDSDSDSDSDDEEGGAVNEYLAASAELEALRASRLEKFHGDREWTPTHVIDFADAKTGDPLYDLVAIFFSVLVRTPMQLSFCEHEFSAFSHCNPCSMVTGNSGVWPFPRRTGRTTSVRRCRLELLTLRLRAEMCASVFCASCCSTRAARSRAYFTFSRWRLACSAGRRSRKWSLAMCSCRRSNREKKKKNSKWWVSDNTVNAQVK
jgi:hypothetical protein